MEDYQVATQKSILFLSGISFNDYESIEDKLDKQRLQSLNYDNLE